MATATAIGADQEIQKDVIEELRWEQGVDAGEIGVAVKDGVVTLTGKVNTFLKKWRAEEAAHRVNGVMAVANDIEVRTIESGQILTSQRPLHRQLDGTQACLPEKCR